MAGLSFVPLTEDVEVGGHRFTVSALPCGVMRREVMPLVMEFDGGDTMALMAAMSKGDVLDPMLKVCHQSVSKADPSITLEALDETLMIADIATLFAAVIRVSGLTRREGDTGEAPRPARSGVSGATSTGASSRPRAGHTPTLTTSSRSRKRPN
jgi:hypothetical protein